LRILTDSEVIALNGLLKLEYDGLAMSRVINNLIVDEDLKKQAEAGTLQKEQRIKAILQFISENDVFEREEEKANGKNSRQHSE